MPSSRSRRSPARTFSRISASSWLRRVAMAKASCLPVDHAAHDGAERAGVEMFVEVVERGLGTPCVVVGDGARLGERAALGDAGQEAEHLVGRRPLARSPRPTPASVRAA